MNNESNETRYLKLMEQILTSGKYVEDRTGVGTISKFGPQVEYNLREDFPLFTTKKIYWKAVVMELLWILQGQTNVNWLKNHKVGIWNEWADENGDLGPVYGHQWRNWGNEEIDQIKNLVARIKKQPNCRRLIVSAWNVDDIEKMNLPPCHSLFQFKVYDNELSCKLYQRSADMFLGVPFNIASYSLLTHLIANECGLVPVEFIHTFGDAHIYQNHVDAVATQLGRSPLVAPKIKINLAPGEFLAFIESSKTMSWQDIQKVIILEGYVSHETIEAKVAV